MSSGPLAVDVRDLHKRFPRTVALAGVSFHVRPGEVVGLLGANGAGKTTTLHVLLGLILPTAGTVTLFGAPPRAHRKAALHRVGFASPEALMDWRLTVAENLRVYAGLYGVTGAAVSAMVERFELAPLLRQPFGELSLGQQTRAGLARALLHVSCVFYPQAVLPPGLRVIAGAVPATHVFEGMRGVLLDGAMPWARLGWATALNLVYLTLAAALLAGVLRVALERGLLPKIR